MSLKRNLDGVRLRFLIRLVRLLLSVKMRLLRTHFNQKEVLYLVKRQFHGSEGESPDKQQAEEEGPWNSISEGPEK